MEMAIQKGPRGYRLAAVIPFTDEEGNLAFEIHSVHNQAECEWYTEIDSALADLFDFILTPAPWTMTTKIHYQVLGPPLPSHDPRRLNIAYYLKDNNEIRAMLSQAAQEAV